jgi:phospholipase C
VQNIKNIIYLMFENRSMDHVLGWLYQNDKPDNIIPVSSNPFSGLQKDFSNPNGQGGKVFVSHIDPGQGQSIPNPDPNEVFQHVQVQIANNMQGFYLDYAGTGANNPAQIMACYSPASLPVLNSLAKQFAVSDAYFSSIPTQTNCNRAFSLSGNSIGSYDDWPNENKRTAMVNNYWKKVDAPGDPYEFKENTIFNVLNNNGYYTDDDWAVFYSQTWPGITGDEGNYCFTQDLFWTRFEGSEDHFKGMKEFYSLASKGKLPVFSYLEPAWYEMEDGFGHNGNDYHPPGNMGCGEIFLYNLYTFLQTTPAWKNTLLIVNFDEHGGTYDHVRPPFFGDPPSPVRAPWADKSDGTLPPDDYEVPFSFTQLGVRVPLILVSPLIEGKTVFRATGPMPFDHTSILATVLNHFGIDKSGWGLGSRTANAPTFEDVITLTPDKARLDVKIASPLEGTCKPGEDTEPNDLQWMIMRRYLARRAKDMKIPKDRFRELYGQHFSGVRTMRHMNEAAGKMVRQMRVEAGAK